MKTVTINNQEQYIHALNETSREVVAEVLRAKQLHPRYFASQYEGYAVILEEIDELWAEIKKNEKNYDIAAQRKEATQAAAMLLRFIVELTQY